MWPTGTRRGCSFAAVAEGFDVARKRPTVTEEEAHMARKGLLWMMLFFFAFVAFIFVSFPEVTVLDVPNEVRAGAPIVSIWPGTIMIFPVLVLLLASIISGIFRAIPWPQAFEYMQRVLVWLLWPTLATMAFSLIGVPPLSSYYMSTHGYHRCERFELGATRRWFTDWVKDPKWCVPGKGADWVKEQAAKEAAEKPSSP